MIPAQTPFKRHGNESNVDSAILTHVFSGLTRDDEALHDDRIRLWDEFNRAWLTTLQRQHDMTEDMYRTNQAVQEPYSLMNSQALEQLSRELVRLCDMVERFGLVDYQMGVQEEEIMDCKLPFFPLASIPSFPWLCRKWDANPHSHF